MYGYIILNLLFFAGVVFVLGVYLNCYYNKHLYQAKLIHIYNAMQVAFFVVIVVVIITAENIQLKRQIATLVSLFLCVFLFFILF